MPRSASTSPVDIRPDHLEIVQNILREYLPVGARLNAETAANLERLGFGIRVP